ncbi:hydroxyisourate hydrolase [Streptomyces sp. NRRL S-87]|uniref:hydroxyisourate hydrolase n=1 Tax=Streptomyces sp. NRRL S-87 TaxID=1463920 RepID=UPI00068AE492|nr:hydroxyisourate hydrolase [Streptomyces sp. NRRL S-87]
MVKVIAEALESDHGHSVVGLRARLETLVDDGWELLAERSTDGTGRIEEWGEALAHKGLYRIVFDIDRYFAGLGTTPGYPEVSATFRASEEGVGHRLSLTFSPHHYAAVFTSE